MRLAPRRLAPIVTAFKRGSFPVYGARSFRGSRCVGECVRFDSTRRVRVALAVDSLNELSAKTLKYVALDTRAAARLVLHISIGLSPRCLGSRDLREFFVVSSRKSSVILTNRLCDLCLDVSLTHGLRSCVASRWNLSYLES